MILLLTEKMLEQSYKIKGYVELWFEGSFFYLQVELKCNVDFVFWPLKKLFRLIKLEVILFGISGLLDHTNATNLILVSDSVFKKISVLCHRNNRALKKNQ